jgi:hypothetical protein
MHTSAPTLAEYTGTLLHPAQARAAIIDHDGHTVPALCLDIELDNALRTHMHLEQPFPPGQFDQAKAAAHRLQQGMRVTVQTPLQGLRIVASGTAHIHTHKPETACRPSP